MINIDRLKTTPFCEITEILDNFAHLDYIVLSEENANGSSIDNKVNLLKHEEYLCNVRNILNGITSALSYINLSILHIKRRHNPQYFLPHGYNEYSVYRYHYYVYIHSIATIHDLYFKLITLLCDIKTGNRMIQWKSLSRQLKEMGENQIVNLVNQFYNSVELHENNRHKASHEGLLTYKPLDNYYTTQIWTYAHRGNIADNKRPEYTEGTKENKHLLRNTKKAYIEGLERHGKDVVEYSISLFDLLLPKLMYKIDATFIDLHRQELAGLANENINLYVLQNL